MHRIAATARMLLLAGAAATAAGAANAAALFSFLEDPTGVTGILSGSIDVSGAPKDSGLSMFGPAAVVPELGALWTGPEDQAFEAYVMTGAVLSWGAGQGATATGWTGTPIGILTSIPQSGIFLLTPQGYAGEALSGTLSFAGATLASLGILPGSYRYDLPNDSVTVSFSPAPVPLPATLPLLLAAAGLAGLALRRRRPA